MGRADEAIQSGTGEHRARTPVTSDRGSVFWRHSLVPAIDDGAEFFSDRLPGRGGPSVRRSAGKCCALLISSWLCSDPVRRGEDGMGWDAMGSAPGSLPFLFPYGARARILSRSQWNSAVQCSAVRHGILATGWGEFCEPIVHISLSCHGLLEPDRISRQASVSLLRTAPGNFCLFHRVLFAAGVPIFHVAVDHASSDW